MRSQAAAGPSRAADGVPAVAGRRRPCVDPGSLLQRAGRLGFSLGRSLAGSRPERIRRAFEFQGFPVDSEKAQELQDVLKNSSNRYLRYLGGRYGFVQVKLDPTSDENPGDASVIYKPTRDGKWEYGGLEELRTKDRIYGLGAIVNVRKWFFDKYPIGKILSMAAHEIGVHIVPYMDELMAKLPPEANAPVSKKYIDEEKVHGYKGRTDHLRVADVEHVDFELYRDVVKDMMGDITKYGGTGGTAKASDLADAYLMDLATFTSTGNRVPLPLNAKGIADKYNDYRKAAALEWDVGPKKSEDVWVDYKALYRRVFPVVVRHYWQPGLAGLITLFLLYYFFRWLLARRLF